MEGNDEGELDTRQQQRFYRSLLTPVGVRPCQHRVRGAGSSRATTSAAGNSRVRKQARLAANAVYRLVAHAADGDKPARITRGKE